MAADVVLAVNTVICCLHILTRIAILNVESSNVNQLISLLGVRFGDEAAANKCNWSNLRYSELIIYIYTRI